jgi:hypothetical protein
MKRFPKGFPKTSGFGKATLDLWEKAGFRPLFQEPFTKLTEFWKRLPMLIVILLAVLSGTADLAAQTSAGNGRETTMYVAVKTAELKDSTGFFGKTLVVLNLGDTVTVLRVSGKWMEVRSAGNPPQTGWMAAASLSSKRVLSSGRSVSGGELALAGKGFSAEVETVYRREELLDYTAIDRMESQTPPREEVLQFLTEGRLSRGD